MVRDAARGDEGARGLFVSAYLGVVRAYLGARWRGARLIDRLDDAVQDVFLECFRDAGALERLDNTRGSSFRTFLYGVVRNVGRRYEERVGLGREVNPPSGFDVDAGDESLSLVFDRLWAQAVLDRAGERQRARAEMNGAQGLRRLELLHLRFVKGLPVREIAAQWKADAAVLHEELRKARKEFKEALREEVRFHLSGPGEAVDRECLRLLSLLEH
ncbi:MAG: sigma factor [Planctomycetota bacterium]|nr:sigma factor [Planctomycetota bacterium]